MVSCNYDEKIAEVVSKAMFQVGVGGQVNVTESPTGETTFSMVKGLVFERGLASEKFLVKDK